MGISYEKATEEVMHVIEKMLLLHHKDLIDAGVTLQVLMAHKYNKDDELVPPMMVRGQQVLAKTSITSHQDRARGIPDAKMVIDTEWGWARLPEFGREALIDHELEHLQIVTEEQGEGDVTVTQPKLDDCGRPKLKIKHHDWELTGFAAVAERHGEAAIEVREMTRWQENYGQFALFPLSSTKEVKVKTKVKVVEDL